MVRDLLLRGFIDHDEVGMGQNQFRTLYIAFHPATGSMVVHDGHAAKVYVDGRPVYGYELLGRPPRAGGDTHGAITVTRDAVIFGGWLKAPPGLLQGPGDRTLAKQDMREKYSHIHALGADGKVRLLWSRKWDASLRPNEWYGEVTDLLYDGHDDVLYFTRADGHAELGLWRLSPSSGRAEWLVRGRTVYKMELKDDKIYATVFNPAHMERSAVVIYDTLSGESRTVEEFEFALDGGRLSASRDGGQIVQLQNRLVAFYGGFFVVVDPYRDRYVAFPFLEVAGSRDGAVLPAPERPLYIPGLRAQKAYPLGIPLVAVNTYEGATEPLHKTTLGLLVRFDPVSPQVVAAAGFVSGLATDGNYVYLATSYANHCPAYTYRSGHGGIFAVPVREFLGRPWGPVRVWVYDGSYRAGESGLRGWFGGIPLKGFETKRLRVFASDEVQLEVAEYSLLGAVTTETFRLRPGWNVVDLGQFYDMVAFRFPTNVDKVVAEIVLEP